MTSGSFEEIEKDLNALFGRSEGIRMLLQLLIMQSFSHISVSNSKEVAEVAIREFQENVEKNKSRLKEAHSSAEFFEGLEVILSSFDSAVRDFRATWDRQHK